MRFCYIFQYILSFGVTIWELLSEKVPFKNMHIYELMMSIVKGKKLEIEMSWHIDVQNLLNRCWHTDPPEERPKLKEVYHVFDKLCLEFPRDAVE